MSQKNFFSLGGVFSGVKIILRTFSRLISVVALGHSSVDRVATDKIQYYNIRISKSTNLKNLNFGTGFDLSSCLHLWYIGKNK